MVETIEFVYIFTENKNIIIQEWLQQSGWKYMNKKPHNIWGEHNIASKHRGRKQHKIWRGNNRHANIQRGNNTKSEGETKKSVKRKQHIIWIGNNIISEEETTHLRGKQLTPRPIGNNIKTWDTTVSVSEEENITVSKDPPSAKETIKEPGFRRIREKWLTRQ